MPCCTHNSCDRSPVAEKKEVSMSRFPKYQVEPYFKLRNTSSITARAAAATPAAGPWTLPALCAAYNWPANLAGGGVIAIVELGGGWVQSDLDAFFQSINQPSPQVTDVSVDGTQNSPNQNVGSPDDPDYEVALDIEVAGAAYYAATGQAATIRVYWSQDIASAVQNATSDGCDVCTISWGSDEANWGNTAAQQMEAAATAATAAGMVVFAASGDNDSGDGGQTPANVDVPSSCPHVVGCGGTYKTST
jgi:kumamolisin